VGYLARVPVSTTYFPKVFLTIDAKNSNLINSALYKKGADILCLRQREILFFLKTSENAGWKILKPIILVSCTM